MSAQHHFIRADGSIVDVAITDRADGDFHIDAPEHELAERRRAVLGPSPWTVVRQVHGAAVVDAKTVPPAAEEAPEADAVCTDRAGVPIAVQGADCAPIAFITNHGPIAVAHAGWRGLAAGVVRSVNDALTARGAIVERAIVGPVIGAECYEFGADDLDHVASLLGDDVRGETASGTPALDMRAAITSSFAAVGVDDVQFVSPCTACGGSGFSHRARHEAARHALVAQIRAKAAPDVVSTRNAGEQSS